MKIDPSDRKIFMQLLPSVSATDPELNKATAKLLGRLEHQMDVLDTTVIPNGEKDVETTRPEDDTLKFKQLALSSIKAYRQYLEDLFGPADLPMAERMKHAAGKLKDLVSRVDERFKGDFIPRDITENPTSRADFLAEEASVWLKGEFRGHYKKTTGEESFI